MKYVFKRACLLLVLALFMAIPAFANNAKMQVTFLDCHQGDCIIIRTAEKTIMIDAGDDNRNVAQAYISKKKELKESTRLLLLTHIETILAVLPN